jgi:hypothetical protein
MRININWVNQHLIEELYSAPIVASVLHDGFDIVLVELTSGEQIAIHLIERDIDIAYIQAVLEQNAANGRFTLFFLWSAMLLPEHGERYLPYDWMMTLLELYGDKIYAFENYGQNAWLFPVYFEPEPSGLWRQVHYGEAVDMAALHCQVVHTEGGFLNGKWRIATFSAEPQPRERRQRAGRHHREPQRPSRAAIFAYYDLLGLAYDADAETVKREYRRLALKFHPDYNKAPDATERMQAINAAYAKIMEYLGEDEPKSSD